MSRAADMLTCGRMIRAAVEAKDKRASWRPITAGACDLINRGTSPVIATATATACENVGRHLRRLILAAGFQP